MNIVRFPPETIKNIWIKFNYVLLFSVAHEMAGRSPHLGEQALARSPKCGYPLDFREVLILELKKANYLA
jgi:hypothetical protein